MGVNGCEVVVVRELRIMELFTLPHQFLQGS
jgi:hypothetical protein